MTTDTILTVVQAAEALGVSRSTVIRRIESGDLAATKTGANTSAYVLTSSEIQRYLQPTVVHRCQHCMAPAGSHWPIHVRHGNGAGHNELCPADPSWLGDPA